MNSPDHTTRRSALKDWVNSLEPTWRMLMVLAAAAAVGAGGQLGMNRLSKFPGKLRGDMDYALARLDTLDRRHIARIDSISLAGLERGERMRGELTMLATQANRTDARLDELICVLSAQARGRDPNTECRDPLPLVPRP